MLNSLINKSIYYWDWYLLRGEKDNLTAAWQFMGDYRKLGGTEYQETENLMREHIINLTSFNFGVCEKNYIEPKDSKKELENDIFGMSWRELERKQGGKLKY
jgi:hypothetical protein